MKLIDVKHSGSVDDDGNGFIEEYKMYTNGKPFNIISVKSDILSKKNLLLAATGGVISCKSNKL